MTPLLAATLLLWHPGSSSWQTLWVERWAFLWGFGLIFFIGRLPWKKFYSLWALYFVCLALRSAIEIPGGVPPSLVAPLHEAALSTLLAGLGLLALHSFPVRKWLKAAGVAQAILILFSPAPHFQVLGLSNPSLAGTFVALTLFEGYWVWLALLAVFTVGRHLPWAVLGVAWLWMQHERHDHRFWFLSMLLPATVFGCLTFPLNGRGPIWSAALQFFRRQVWDRQMFGLGAGSASVYLPAIQLDPEKAAPQTLSLWLHNDWFQIIFEWGYVGLFLAVAIFVLLFLKAQKRNEAVLLGYAVAMVGNPVLHFPLTALVLWAVIQEEAFDQIQDGNSAGPIGQDDGVYGGMRRLRGRTFRYCASVRDFCGQRWRTDERLPKTHEFHG